MRDDSVTVPVTLRIKEGKKEGFGAHLCAVLVKINAEANCLHPVYGCHDPEDTTSFMLYESWSDSDYSLNVRVRKPYLAATQDLWDREREARRIAPWEQVDLTGTGATSAGRVTG